MYIPDIFNNFLSKSDTPFLTWYNYAAQIHPSLGKVKGKGKISPDQWNGKAISMDWKFSKFWND